MFAYADGSLYYYKSTLVKEDEDIIKRIWFSTYQEAAKAYKITAELWMNKWIDLEIALQKLTCDINQAENVIAFNIRFKEYILNSDFKKNFWQVVSKEWFCLIKASKKFCKLSEYCKNYKWQKLFNLYEKILDK